MNRNWTDSRDGSEWEVKVVPLQGRMGPGDAFPLIGETSYALWFSSPGGASHHTTVDPDVGSRFSGLLDAELAELLDEARGFGLGRPSS